MTHTTKAISYDVRIRAFWTLASVCIIAFAVYIYAVNMTIRNTAIRQKLESDVTELAVDQSALEFARISRSQEISIEVAYAHGFEDVDAPLYISRVPGSALTYNAR